MNPGQPGSVSSPWDEPRILAAVRLFADSSAADATLRLAKPRGTRCTVDTAPLGGFIAVL